jgi:hypothetical protein
MDRAVALLVGAGLGACLMYFLDPQVGRRRRAGVRDQAVRLTHKVEDAAGTVAQDARNRARGLAAGDLSVLVGGKQALKHPFQGGWSPTGRALMGLAGGAGCRRVPEQVAGAASDAAGRVADSLGLGKQAEGAPSRRQTGQPVRAGA